MYIFIENTESEHFTCTYEFGAYSLADLKRKIRDKFGLVTFGKEPYRPVLVDGEVLGWIKTIKIIKETCNVRHRL